MNLVMAIPRLAASAARTAFIGRLYLILYAVLYVLSYSSARRYRSFREVPQVLNRGDRERVDPAGDPEIHRGVVEQLHGRGEPPQRLTRVHRDLQHLDPPHRGERRGGRPHPHDGGMLPRRVGEQEEPQRRGAARRALKLGAVRIRKLAERL